MEKDNESWCGGNDKFKCKTLKPAFQINLKLVCLANHLQSWRPCGWQLRYLKVHNDSPPKINKHSWSPTDWRRYFVCNLGVLSMWNENAGRYTGSKGKDKTVKCQSWDWDGQTSKHPAKEEELLLNKLLNDEASEVRWKVFLHLSLMFFSFG